MSKNKKLKHAFIIEVGDSLMEGHCETSDYALKTNLKKKAIEKAYKAGTKILGFDYIEVVASEVDGPYISEKYVNIMQKHIKVSYDKIFNFLNEEDYVDNYLKIVKLGNPKFKYEYISYPSGRIIIGGYGLFCAGYIKKETEQKNKTDIISADVILAEWQTKTNNVSKLEVVKYLRAQKSLYEERIFDILDSIKEPFSVLFKDIPIKEAKTHKAVLEKFGAIIILKENSLKENED